MSQNLTAAGVPTQGEMHIKGERYLYKVEDPGVALVVITIAKCDAKGWPTNQYTVSISDHGHRECTCPDFTMRKGPIGENCKHILECLSRDLLTVVQDAPADGWKPENDPQYQEWLESMREVLD